MGSGDGDRRLVSIHVVERDSHTLKKTMREYLHSESIIYTNCWIGHNELDKNFRRHLTINHKIFFEDPVTNVHANAVEGNWHLCIFFTKLLESKK